MARQFRFVRSVGRIPAGATKDMTVAALHSIAQAEGVEPFALGIWTDVGDGRHYTERQAEREKAKQEASLWTLLRKWAAKTGEALP